MPSLTFNADELVEIVREHAQRSTGSPVQKSDVTITVKPDGVDDFGHPFGPPYKIEASVAIRLGSVTVNGRSVGRGDPFYG